MYGTAAWSSLSYGRWLWVISEGYASGRPVGEQAGSAVQGGVSEACDGMGAWQPGHWRASMATGSSDSSSSVMKSAGTVFQRYVFGLRTIWWS